MNYYDTYYDPYYVTGYEGYPPTQPVYQTQIPLPQPPIETAPLMDTTSVTTPSASNPSTLMDTLDKYKYVIIGCVCFIIFISIILSFIFFTSSPKKQSAPNDQLNKTTTPPTTPKNETTTTQPPTTPKNETTTPLSVFCNDTNLKNIMLKYPYWISNDHIAAVNILANITGTVPSTLQSMSNEQLYKQLKNTCKF